MEHFRLRNRKPFVNIKKLTDNKNSNWEFFFDDFFSRYNAEVKKEYYKNGLTIEYKKGNIYVWCNLNMQEGRIEKIEFGRFINGCAEANWIKGVYINDKKEPVEFRQASFDSEDGGWYKAIYDEQGKLDIQRFLQVPCEIGWEENEYRLGKEGYYKIVAEVFFEREKLTWTIPLYTVIEQDIPGVENLFKPLTNFIQDSFINDFRRHVDKIILEPMYK